MHIQYQLVLKNLQDFKLSWNIGFKQESLSHSNSINSNINRNRKFWIGSKNANTIPISSKYDIGDGGKTCVCTWNMLESQSNRKKIRAMTNFISPDFSGLIWFSVIACAI